MTTTNLQLEIASPADAPEILNIYAPYITDSIASFETKLPSLDNFTARMTHTLTLFPYIKAVRDGKIVGYAYASPLRNRRAYDPSAEATVYLHASEQRRGTGTRLYHALEALLRLSHIYSVYACIAWPYPMSERFHEKEGYTQCGLFKNCAFKFGEWLGVVWMVKSLQPLPKKPAPFVPFPALDKSLVLDILNQ